MVCLRHLSYSSATATWLHNHITMVMMIFAGYLLKRASSTNCTYWYTTLSLGGKDLLQNVTVMPLCHSVLLVPHTRLLFVERAFRIAAPKAWNQLPRNIRCVDNTNTFKKKKRKTFLFIKFYFLLICFISVCTGQLLLYNT